MVPSRRWVALTCAASHLTYSLGSLEKLLVIRQCSWNWCLVRQFHLGQAANQKLVAGKHISIECHVWAGPVRYQLLLCCRDFGD